MEAIMKRIMVFTCVVVISLFSLPSQIKAANAVEEEYTSKFRKIHFDLKIKRLDLLLIMNRKLNIGGQQKLDLDYKGRISDDLRIQEQDTKNEETRIKEDISKLEQDRDNLKLDAAKYYRGKLPKSLEKKWREITVDYSKFLETEYTPELNKINEEYKQIYSK